MWDGGEGKSTHTPRHKRWEGSQREVGEVRPTEGPWLGCGDSNRRSLRYYHKSKIKEIKVDSRALRPPQLPTGDY